MSENAVNNWLQYAMFYGQQIPSSNTPFFTLRPVQGTPQGVSTLAPPTATQQGAPQWTRSGHIQSFPQQQPQQSVRASGTLMRPSVEDIVTAVVEQLNKNKREIAPSSNNDQLLVDALKKGVRKGWTPREAIEKLGDVRRS